MSEHTAAIEIPTHGRFHSAVQMPQNGSCCVQISKGSGFVSVSEPARLHPRTQYPVSRGRDITLDHGTMNTFVLATVLLFLIVWHWTITPRPLWSDKRKQRKQLIISGIAGAALIALVAGEHVFGSEVQHAWASFGLGALAVVFFLKQWIDYRTLPPVSRDAYRAQLKRS